MKIKNFKELAISTKRTDALSIIHAGLVAVDTRVAIQKSVECDGKTLRIADTVYTLSAYDRVRVVAVGKCSVEAVYALEELLGDVLTDGIALDVVQGVSKTGTVTFLTGTHPLPTQMNVDATKCILDFLDSSTERDLVIMSISGGGSTLASQPLNGLSVDEESRAIAALMNAGAPIQDMNTIRKHLSRARGGGLAQCAYPATVASLIFSDVPGDDISYIASGPTVCDTTTISDAQALLVSYGLEAIGPYLIETPKGTELFEKVTNTIIVSNSIALEAMKKESIVRGYTAEIVTSTLTGEARSVAHDIVERIHSAPEKTVLLFGGETTVTSEGPHGIGGRNQEVALAGLRTIADGEVLIACASDGRDNTDVAGAVCDTITMHAAQEKGLSVEECLASHSSFLFFEKSASHIVTGATGSNVSDLIIALK
ncbi:DUF4147 domain-containing protein [Candidatus Campbellbacteria bacterium]|nr:MAG: DUF4147 domain-containing protein [Candidatus Campbellbacteria bacterium]